MYNNTSTTGNTVLLVLATSLSLSGQALAVEPLALSQCPVAPPLEAVYHGDDLTVTPSEAGARLRCVFQRLEGEVTREGLWLRSTLTDTLADRFRVVACSVGRVPARASSGREGIPAGLASTLPASGNESVEGSVARFTRPG